MRQIIKLAGRHLWAVALLGILTITLTLAGVVQVLAMRNFLDYAVAGNKAGFLRWFGIFFALIFFQLIGGAAKSLFQQAATTDLYNKVRLYYFNLILTREYSTLRGRHSGEYMQLIASDTSIVVGTIFGLPMEICSLLTQFIGAALCLTFLQGKLTLLLLGCFVVMLTAGLPLRKYVRKYHKQTMEAQGKVISILQEVLNNLLIIRAFQATDGVVKNAGSRMADSRRITMKKAVFSQVIGSGSATAVNIAYIIGMLWCGMGIVKGSVSFGTFSAVWQLIGQITGPAKQFSSIMPQYYTMMASAERLKELENLPAEKEDSSIDWNRIAEEFSQIRCEDLTFSYDKTDSEQNVILSNLNFTINSGDFIAITGQSGIGKSTLLKLLLGVYFPERGNIYVVCNEGSRIPLDAGGRNMISYVPQGNFLMSGTIREAVHFWQNEEIEEEKMKEACRIAEAEGFISRLELGYDTRLEERGAGLSEGQLQRLAIARAIYSEKPVLLLDEATSALDEQTEARVLENLQKLQNRTVIIVTHRKAALDICNRIVEMKEGRIREHNDL